MRKFGFRIKTRGGMTVDNLQVSATDRENAEGKIRQIYNHCEILGCHEIQPLLKDGSQDMTLEHALTLISLEADPETAAKTSR